MKKTHALAAAGALGALALGIYGVTLRWAPPRSPHAAPNVATEVAPNFSIQRLNDNAPLRLADYRGKVLVLNFWATWCGPCRVEMPWLTQVYSRHHAQGLELVGVNMDDSDGGKVSAFAKNMRVNYTVAKHNDAIVDAYGGVRFLPQSVIIDRSGRVIRRTFGMPNQEDFEAALRGALGVSRAPG